MIQVGSPGGREPVIFYTHPHGWYLSVRSPSYWWFWWRFRVRVGWDDRRRLRLAGHVEVRRTRPSHKSRVTLVERYAHFMVWLEDESVPGRAWWAARSAWAYRGGLSRRRVFGYYYRVPFR